MRDGSRSIDHRYDEARLNHPPDGCRRRSRQPDGRAVRHHGDLMEPASRDQALDAVRAFQAERGRLPRWREWERATPTRPCAKTVERRWGWRELLAEAIGIKPNQVDVSLEAILDDRARVMLAELRAVRDELGRLPSAAEWEAAGRRPSPRTFVRHFGSWAEACRAAGRAPP